MSAITPIHREAFRAWKHGFKLHKKYSVAGIIAGLARVVGWYMAYAAERTSEEDAYEIVHKNLQVGVEDYREQKAAGKTTPVTTS